MASENLTDMSEFILPTGLNSPGDFLYQENNLEDVITLDNEDLSMLLDLEPSQKNLDSSSHKENLFQQTIQESLLDANVVAKSETLKHDATAFHADEEFPFLQQTDSFVEPQTVVESQAVLEPETVLEQNFDNSLANPNWGNNFVQTFEQLSVNSFPERVTQTPQIQVAGSEQPVSRGRKRQNQQEIHDILNEIKQLEVMEKCPSPEADRETIRHKVKRKKNTVACRKSRQKKKEFEEAKSKKIDELEQKLKQVEDESSKKLENMKKQFGIIVQAMLQASIEHVSPEAKNFIFTEWSKLN